MILPQFLLDSSGRVKTVASGSVSTPVGYVNGLMVDSQGRLVVSVSPSSPGLLTEAGDNLTTEAGDHLVIEG